MKIWQRALMLPWAGGSVAASSLLTSLIGYWKLEEASGTRADSSGRGNDCNVINGAPGNTTGKVGNALACASASSQSVERASNSDLQTGDIDFTVAGWINLTTNASNQALVSKNSSGAIEYALRYVTGTDRFQFFVSSNGTGFTNNVIANTFGSPSLSTWYFVVAWHDSVANTINIQVNNGTVDSGAYALGLIATAGAFSIGNAKAVSWFLNGAADEVGFWKRVLTAAERTTLYNGGNGTTYPF